MTNLTDKENKVGVNVPAEDNVALYLSEIREYPLLSADEEKEIAIRCAKGDADAIRTMVSSNLRLVVSIAKDYAGRGVPLLDLIQEGSIGLLTATQKFNPDMEFRFSTYATKWIRQGVTRCIGNSKGLIRVPLHTADKIHKVLQAKNELIQENEAEPTIAEITQRSELSEERVVQLLSLNPELCSLDTPLGDESDGTLGDILAAGEERSPYEEMVRKDLTDIMDTLLNNLNERQQTVLKLHYGFEDGICYSLEQIGQMLGISKERARQIDKQAIEKMRILGKDSGLEDFRK